MVGNQKQALSVEPVSFSGDSNDYRNFVHSDKSWRILPSFTHLSSEATEPLLIQTG